MEKDKEEGKHDKKESSKEKLGTAISVASDKIEEAYARLARIEKQLNLGVTASGPASGPASEALRQFDELVTSHLTPFLDKSVDIGDKVELLGDLVGTTANVTRAYLVAAAQSKKPTDADEAALGAPLKMLVAEITTLADKASGPFADHVKLVALIAPALHWPLESKPAMAVQKAIRDFDSLASKVKGGEFKDRVDHTVWVDSLAAYLTGLEQLIAKHCSDGNDAPKTLQYRQRGYIALSQQIPSASLSFDKLKDRWNCVRQVGAKDVVIDAGRGRAVFVLHCQSSSIVIKGAPSRVLIDQCQHTQVTCEADVAAALDIVAGLDVEVTVKGNVKDISITKTHGVKIAVCGSNASEVDLITSASTGLKLTLTEGDNKTEYNVPSKFKVRAKNGKMSVTGL